mmetsp:Transcript_38144/g.86498  ORF Transcript_38144/g.86498 Transcript_38144/m.86498 type:complete len:202 (+) Transcript_38144:1462-2067(+)
MCISPKAVFTRVTNSGPRICATTNILFSTRSIELTVACIVSYQNSILGPKMESPLKSRLDAWSANIPASLHESKLGAFCKKVAYATRFSSMDASAGSSVCSSSTAPMYRSSGERTSRRIEYCLIVHTYGGDPGGETGSASSIAVVDRTEPNLPASASTAAASKRRRRCSPCKPRYRGNTSKVIASSRRPYDCSLPSSRRTR